MKNEFIQSKCSSRQPPPPAHYSQHFGAASSLSYNSKSSNCGIFFKRKIGVKQKMEKF